MILLLMIINHQVKFGFRGLSASGDIIRKKIQTHRQTDTPRIEHIHSQQELTESTSLPVGLNSEDSRLVDNASLQARAVGNDLGDPDRAHLYLERTLGDVLFTERHVDDVVAWLGWYVDALPHIRLVRQFADLALLLNAPW